MSTAPTSWGQTLWNEFRSNFDFISDPFGQGDKPSPYAVIRLGQGLVTGATYLAGFTIGVAALAVGGYYLGSFIATQAAMGWGNSLLTIAGATIGGGVVSAEIDGALTKNGRSPWVVEAFGIAAKSIVAAAATPATLIYKAMRGSGTPTPQAAPA